RFDAGRFGGLAGHGNGPRFVAGNVREITVHFKTALHHQEIARLEVEPAVADREADRAAWGVAVPVVEEAAGGGIVDDAVAAIVGGRPDMERLLRQVARSEAGEDIGVETDRVDSRLEVVD